MPCSGFSSSGEKSGGKVICVPSMPWTTRLEYQSRSRSSVRTDKTNRRSSSIRASCTSRGTLSSATALAFPFPLPFDAVCAVADDVLGTREFKGALMNDFSAMNEGWSSLATRSKQGIANEIQQRHTVNMVLFVVFKPTTARSCNCVSNFVVLFHRQ